MSESLRDQLKKLGFKPQSSEKLKPTSRKRFTDPADKMAERRARSNPPPPRQPNARAKKEEFDLAKAYALRASEEKQQQLAAEKLRQEQARARREARARLDRLLAGKALNDPNAEIARHFNYGNKIKRIYVTEAQLRALNAGELGVVQLSGRYLLIGADLLQQVETIYPSAIALKIDPAAREADEAYTDPQYRIPDDLMW